ncbi:hypothetical protein [Stenotrophomonas sp. JAG2]|uniref:hypothetical protein n=1 Tax=Stenotrophomonas sp. JAG2 TaxID=3229243 RepID=UPI0034E27DEE
MSPQHLKHFAALAIASAAALAGCAPTNAPAPPQAAQDAAVAKAAPLAHLSRTERLRAFLTERYGKAAKLSGKWRGSWTQDGDTRLTDWHVCAEQPVVTGDSWQQLLAVCGSPLDGAHPDPGAIDFFVLRPEADRFAVAAELTGQNFGSRGEPGTVQILRAGSDFYGFRIEHGWFGQGYSLITQTLVLPGPNGLVEAGGVRSHIDNTAAYDCDDADAEPDCQARLFNLDFTLHFDDRDPAARQWPLLIEETGLGCGGQPVRREHRFTLDPTTWSYAFPEALRREECE